MRENACRGCEANEWALQQLIEVAYTAIKRRLEPSDIVACSMAPDSR